MTETYNTPPSEQVSYSAQTPPATPSPAKGPIILFKIMLFVGVILLISLAFLAGRMYSSGKTAHAPSTGQPESYSSGNSAVANQSFAPVSEAGPQSYPVVEDNKLTWVNIADPTQKNTSYTKQVNFNGGAYGLGDSSYLEAPDYKKVAIITEDGVLDIVSSDGTVVQPNPELRVAYLTGWSKDAQKLLVYSTSPTANAWIFPEGPSFADPQNETYQLKKSNLGSGFYLIDLQEQTVKALPVLDKSLVSGFIDSNRLLLIHEDTFINKTYYSIFDLDSYVLDATKVFKLTEGYFGTQVSFSNDGSIWSVKLSPTEKVSTPESESSIYFGSFPNIPTDPIASGGWADVQGQIVSPLGTKVTYLYSPVVNQPSFVKIYENGNTTEVGDGIPRGWVSDTKLIYTKHIEGGSSDTTRTSVHVYDTETKESRLLYTYSGN